MEYTLTQATLNFHYSFDFMLPMLPVPGATPVFQTLVRELQPFKISAASISVENPSNRLSDLVMVINLLNDQLSVRIGYEYFEITVLEPQQVQGSCFVILNGLMEALCKVFKSMPVELGLGLPKVHWRGHLKFDKSFPEQLINKNKLQIADTSIEIVPTATIYKLQTKDPSRFFSSMFVIANSEIQEKTIVIELMLTYNPTNNFTDTVSKFKTDLNHMMDSLGLMSGLPPQKNTN